MKIAALIIGVLGAIATLALGAKWVHDYEANRELIKGLGRLAASFGRTGGDLADPLAALERVRTAGYLMIALGLAALASAALVFKAAKISGGVMILAAVVPAIFAPSSLIASSWLILAGIFALAARRSPAPGALARA